MSESYWFFLELLVVVSGWQAVGDGTCSSVVMN